MTNDAAVAASSEPYTCRNLIGGSWRPSTGPMRALHSPHDGSLIGHVPMSTPSEVQEAARAAAAAFPAWRALTLKERSAPLFRWRELMLTHLDHLAALAASESGKTVAEARAGILKGIEVAEFALSLQNLDDGGSMEVSQGVTCQIQRRPLGVVAGITPFNFPAMVPLWMIPIALTVGNCFILKPSEKVPLTSQKMGEIFIAAGYPAGVFSVINGGKETVEALIDATEVAAVGFVGSTPAARAVYQRATSLGKRALALGGAKNPVIVVPDADPEFSVQGIVDSFTGCAGQRCMAASLLIAVGKVDHIIDAVVKRASSLKLGKDQQMGAIIDAAAKARITDIIGRAEKDGAKIILDGRRVTPPSGSAAGHWLAPTIIDHASPGMECATTEIFGPVLTIVRVPDLSAALALEATSAYGNAVSVFTTNGRVARTVTDHATSGMIGINIGVPVPREPFSFGGTKASKFGHGDITGRSALDFWTHLIKLTSKWSATAAQNWMS
ncbi:MAG: aldehyde dehydrogenase family protein [Deltaproteobacteria bacterium]|nr:aldehyde dehydrogenase family protein [Deltaproteobacteria bacterium]